MANSPIGPEIDSVRAGGALGPHLARAAHLTQREERFTQMYVRSRGQSRTTAQVLQPLVAPQLFASGLKG